MAPIEHYQELKRRKAALLVESDLNRLVLRLELESFRNSTARLDSTLGAARRVAPWLLPLVSVVGVFAGGRVRKAGQQAGWIKTGLRLLPLLLQLRRSKSAQE